MTHVTCRLPAKNRNQLQNPTLGRLIEYGLRLPFYSQTLKNTYRYGEVTSHNLWSLYDSHVVGMTWHHAVVEVDRRIRWHYTSYYYTSPSHWCTTHEVSKL